MVPKSGISLLAGEIASGKTFLGLDLALGMASGRNKVWGMEMAGDTRLIADREWDGAFTQGRQDSRAACEKARVRYFCGDADPNLIAERVVKLCHGYPNKNKTLGMDVPNALDLDFAPHEFSSVESFDWLQKEIELQGYQLLIFDGLAQYLPGMADGSARVVSVFLSGLRQLVSKTGISVVLIHPFNKRLAARLNKWGLPTTGGEERVRGSSELLAGVDSVLLLSRPEAVKLGARGRVLLRVVKNRLGQAGAGLQFTIVDGEESLHLLFERPGHDSDVKPRRLVDAAFDELMKILMAHDDQKFSRRELTRLLEERMDPPGIRSLAESFTLLGKEERVRVEKDPSGKKFYSWAEPGTGEFESISYGLPPAEAIDLVGKYMLTKAQMRLMDYQVDQMQGKNQTSALEKALEQFAEKLGKEKVADS